MAPTVMGAMNPPIPPAVMIQPQAIATFSGVIYGSSIGNVRRMGKYSHEPSPNITIEA